jgi:hypothetical protein
VVNSKHCGSGRPKYFSDRNPPSRDPYARILTLCFKHHATTFFSGLLSIIEYATCTVTLHNGSNYLGLPQEDSDIRDNRNVQKFLSAQRVLLHQKKPQASIEN